MLLRGGYMTVVGRDGKKKDTLDRATQNTIKQIAYEHGMSYEDARTHYLRTKDD